MKTDTYTKIILTIIALALTANLIKGSVTPAMADSKKYASVPINADGSINVNVKHISETLDVNITGVASYAFLDVQPLIVKISQ